MIYMSNYEMTLPFGAYPRVSTYFFGAKLCRKKKLKLSPRRTYAIIEDETGDGGAGEKECSRVC